MTYSTPSQNGSALFMILIAVALFAALSFAISQQRDSGKALSTEKVRLLASDVIDMGNKMADTVAQMRLRRIAPEKISFENAIVTGYANAGCTSGTCKVFEYAGGGRDWETPAPDINKGAEWGYTADVAVQDMGTADADLVGFMPNVSLELCNRINKLIGVQSDPPPTINSLIANKFTGTYALAPFMMSDPDIRGKKSACVSLSGPSGTAFGALSGSFYAYYQVLLER